MAAASVTFARISARAFTGTTAFASSTAIAAAANTEAMPMVRRPSPATMRTDGPRSQAAKPMRRAEVGQRAAIGATYTSTPVACSQRKNPSTRAPSAIPAARSAHERPGRHPVSASIATTKPSNTRSPKK